MLLVISPTNLTQPERECFDWAVSGLEEALDDSLFVQDNPGIETDAESQLEDLLYRLEEQAKDMIDPADPKTRRAAAAAKQVAVKLKAANCW